MKQVISLLAILFLGMQVNAQFSKASLLASGLTCSMCSRAVKVALEEVPFVEKVMVDIKSQQYQLTFKQDSKVNFDVLSKAVEDAGFSVAKLKVTADVKNVTLKKDSHIQIGDQYFHFLNASGQTLNGAATFNIVDKNFVPAKEYKKWSTSSKMVCVQTGKAGDCCSKENIAAQSRVYHVII
jgi:copper chaperone CopZ